MQLNYLVYFPLWGGFRPKTIVLSYRYANNFRFIPIQVLSCHCHHCFCDGISYLYTFTRNIYFISRLWNVNFRRGAKWWINNYVFVAALECEWEKRMTNTNRCNVVRNAIETKSEKRGKSWHDQINRKSSQFVKKWSIFSYTRPSYRMYSCRWTQWIIVENLLSAHLMYAHSEF